MIQALLDRKLGMTGHGADGIAHPLAGANKQRQNQLGGLQVGFPHQTPHRFGYAKPSFAMDRKRHVSIIYYVVHGGPCYVIPSDSALGLVEYVHWTVRAGRYSIERRTDRLCFGKMYRSRPESFAGLRWRGRPGSLDRTTMCSRFRVEGLRTRHLGKRRHRMRRREGI